MQFGVLNAVQRFQPFVDQALHGLLSCCAYLDEILAASYNREQVKLLYQLFVWLQEFEILINLNKCVVGPISVIFLGHQVSADGFCPMEKVNAIQDFPWLAFPRKPREFFKSCQHLSWLHSTLYQQNQCSLHYLFKSSENSQFPFKWNPAANNALITIKEIANSSLLTHPAPCVPTSLFRPPPANHQGKTSPCLIFEEVYTGRRKIQYL